MITDEEIYTMLAEFLPSRYWLAAMKLSRAMYQLGRDSVKHTEPPQSPDCQQCTNRGRVNGLSEETFCEVCKWQQTNKQDYFERKSA